MCKLQTVQAASGTNLSQFLADAHGDQEVKANGSKEEKAAEEERHKVAVTLAAAHLVSCKRECSSSIASCNKTVGRADQLPVAPVQRGLRGSGVNVGGMGDSLTR